VFASLFRRAEASVDNAIGDLGNRVLIAIPFLIAVGFAAAGLSMIAIRAYGPEIGNLVVAGGFAVVGFIIAIVVKLRNRGTPAREETAEAVDQAPLSATSIFDNEQLMGVVSAAAPILLPALLRTATKNWPLLLAVAGGLYVFSLSDESGVTTTPNPTPQA
jgi:hypothetical protein